MDLGITIKPDISLTASFRPPTRPAEFRRFSFFGLGFFLNSHVLIVGEEPVIRSLHSEVAFPIPKNAAFGTLRHNTRRSPRLSPVSATSSLL